MRRGLGILALALCAIAAMTGGVASCVGDNGPVTAADAGKQPGTEGAPCLPGSQCVTGLVCLSDTCIALPDAGDGGLPDSSDAAVDAPTEAAVDCGVPKTLDIGCSGGNPTTCLSGTAGEICRPAAADCMAASAGMLQCFSNASPSCGGAHPCCVANIAAPVKSGTCPVHVSLMIPPPAPGNATECAAVSTCPSGIVVCVPGGSACLGSQSCVAAEFYTMSGGATGVMFGICQ
jgi:hypothetical protein